MGKDEMNNKIITEKIAITKTIFIQFNVQEKALVLLKIMNQNDEQIRLLVNEMLAAGFHNTNFNYANLNKGIYIIKQITDNGLSLEIEQSLIEI